ncbi:amidohydrolase family protein [Leifsonia sp. YAF41]|uniref:amidohydrolase family protein n=1 Tax=Leifsonia sp. YAF41 TaxID=3233086 RepID=UPI003F962CB6
MKSKVFAADWVLPISAQPIRNGVVVVSNDRVLWLGAAVDLPAEFADSPTETRSGVLMPGLVNAHTHLQYTHFDEVGRGSYTSFEDWSDAFGLVYDEVTDPSDWRTAALDGARQGIATGTTVFAEIVTNDEARGSLDACQVTGIEYLEAIGEFGNSWRDGGRDTFLARLEQTSAVPFGVSPHAPYSLDGAVISDLMQIAAERNLRVHSHVGESAVEADLYRSGVNTVLTAYGDLRDEFELVRKGGVGHTTAEYADSIGLLVPTTHLAHAIYLDRAERDLLRARGTQVALCPRSNKVIGLDAPPVAAYLAEGHEIAVGTDSLASSPSMDLMADVALLAVLAREQGYTDDDLYERLVRAVTLGGALAMGVADSLGYGSLTVGGPADLAVFEVHVQGDDVERAVVEQAAGRCTLTVSAGRIVHDSSLAPAVLKSTDAKLAAHSLA